MLAASPILNSSAAIAKQRRTSGLIVDRRHGSFAPLKHTMVVIKRLDTETNWLAQANFCNTLEPF